ncbi:hypothetical protein [Nocardioides antri]|uniref:Uncharacterized protein n=1 Tax=Nocardioides antri TaxID=2607659 RepID=A0A5B1M839_9ACTN|nr:hypothetical protein [Nocardioides antri]KAA1428973.1 hypothetical protein F0U47_01815 [Nocardioides antri]
MASDLRGAGPSRGRDLLVGGLVGAGANLLCAVVAWFWAFRGEDYPNDGIRGWLTAIVISGLAVSFAAVMSGQRRCLVWGVVTGCAVAVGIELGALFVEILRHSE